MMDNRDIILRCDASGVTDVSTGVHYPYQVVATDLPAYDLTGAIWPKSKSSRFYVKEIVLQAVAVNPGYPVIHEWTIKGHDNNEIVTLALIILPGVSLDKTAFNSITTKPKKVLDSGMPIILESLVYDETTPICKAIITYCEIDS